MEHKFILKILSDEVQQFIDDMGLPLKRTAKIHSIGGVRNSASKTDLYFSQLSERQLQGLYKLYKYDFLIFNYDFKHYLDLIT